MEIEGTPEEIAVLIKEFEIKELSDKIKKIANKKFNNRKKIDWNKNWQSIRVELGTRKNGMAIKEMIDFVGVSTGAHSYEVVKEKLKQSRGLVKIGHKYMTKENSFLYHNKVKPKKVRKYKQSEKLEETRRKIFKRAIQLCKQNADHGWSMSKALSRAWAEYNNKYGKISKNIKRQGITVIEESDFKIYPLDTKNTKILVSEIKKIILFQNYTIDYNKAKNMFKLKDRWWSVGLWENFLSSICQEKENLMVAVGHKLNMKIESSSMRLVISKQ